MLVQFPLTAKQARSMIQMQRVQPEIKKIQAEVQGRQGEAERGAAEVLPREQDQPARRLPADGHHDPNRDRGVPHVLARACSTTSPQTGTLGELYHDICGNGSDDRRKACGTGDRARTRPQAMRFLGMSLNLTAHGAASAASPTVLPYYVLDRRSSCSPVGTRCARRRPANCRAATRRRTRRCRR